MREYRSRIGATSVPMSHVLIDEYWMYCMHCQNTNRNIFEHDPFFYRLRYAALHIRLTHLSLFDTFSGDCISDNFELERIYTGCEDSLTFFPDYRYYDFAKNQQPGMSDVPYPTTRFYQWLEDDAEHSWDGTHGFCDHFSE